MKCIHGSDNVPEDPDRLQQWSDALLIKFYPNKCEVTKIGNNKTGPYYDYHLAENILEDSTCERFRG